MFRKNSILDVYGNEEDVPVGKFVVFDSDAAYTRLIEIGYESDGYLEEFTDKLEELVTEGIIKISGSHKINYNHLYLDHRDNKYIVPTNKATCKKTKNSIIVYKTVVKNLKSLNKLSNQSYFISIEEFIRFFEFKGKI